MVRKGKLGTVKLKLYEKSQQWKSMELELRKMSAFLASCVIASMALTRGAPLTAKTGSHMRKIHISIIILCALVSNLLWVRIYNNTVPSVLLVKYLQDSSLPGTRAFFFKTAGVTPPCRATDSNAATTSAGVLRCKGHTKAERDKTSTMVSKNRFLSFCLANTGPMSSRWACQVSWMPVT